MRSRHLILSLLVPMCINASAAAYFQAGPSGSKFPANMHTANTSGVIPDKNVYKNGYTIEGWTVDAADASSYAFVAPSHSGSATAMASSLTTDAFFVDSSDAWLRWNARSILPGFLETYDVVVNNLTDGNSVVVAGIADERHDWQTRLVSLEDFAGKEISVTFICKSVDKYMLAVKDIYAGTLDKQEFTINHVPQRYAAGQEGALAAGEITNVGAPVENASIICRIGESESAIDIVGMWNPGESMAYGFEIPTALNESTEYSIGVKDNEGNFHQLLSTSVFSSHFVRNILVDEGTGMWCNNCPGGTLTLDKIKAEYGGNAIILSCHNRDPFALENYWAALQFYAVPYMMLNRERATVGSDTKNFSKGYLSPTIADVTLPHYIAIGDDNSIEVEIATRFAETTDNSDGRYKIGYTLSADIYSPGAPYYQENNLTFPRYEQYYFLPSFIPPSLARFDNVVLSEEYAFSGIEGSIPPSLEAMTSYPTSVRLTLPALADNAEEVRFVAYIIDTTTGVIVNAASSIIGGSNGIKEIEGPDSGNSLSISISGDHRCIISGVDGHSPVTLTVTDIAGRIIDRFEATAATISEMQLRFPAGVAIITARAAGMTAATKYFSFNN